MHVFWIEGLPGSGKSTLLRELLLAFAGQAILFPKTDLVSIFAKGLKFNFREYMRPGVEADIAIEMLKTGMLNSMVDCQDKFIVSERSYISTLVYYSILAHEGNFPSEKIKQLKKTFCNMERHYREHFIFLKCIPEISLHRDTGQYSNFWNDFKRLQDAESLYDQHIGCQASNVVIDTGVLNSQNVLEKSFLFISGFVSK